MKIAYRGPVIYGRKCENSLLIILVAVEGDNPVLLQNALRQNVPRQNNPYKKSQLKTSQASKHPKYKTS
jgi:hypothetical protein